ncbi:MAG TPA: baseplate J/gp47 family protein [Longimicrobium sp.]|nr:baseplate J/gp47 family protein [Longimicrobium sp.]
MSAPPRTDAAPAPADGDPARRRAQVAGTPGVYALERAEGVHGADGTLRVRLHFTPRPDGAPGAPANVPPDAVRVTGPAGAVAVARVEPVPGSADTLVAVTVGHAAPPAAPYTVRLVGLAGVDPLSSTARFTPAPAPLSVAPDAGTPQDDGGPPLSSPDAGAPVDEEGPPLPRIDYLTRDYDTFRAAMLDRMSVTLPAWTERNPADIGIVLVELLAYAADSLSYYQDAAATEAYLGTARLRTSLSRHARLLDYRVNQGCSAVAWVQVRVSQNGIVVPKGTRLYSRTADDAPVLLPGTAPHARALREQPLPFETLHPLQPHPGLNEAPLYGWGAESYALARGATRATLRDARVPGGRALDALAPGHVLVLQEQRGEGGGPPDPAHRQAVRVVAVERRVDEVGGALAGGGGGVPVVEVRWHDADALAFRLVVAGTAGGAPYADGALALGNLVLAEHGAVAGPWTLPPVPASGPYRPYVPVGGVSRRPPASARAREHASAADAVLRDPAGAVGEVWMRDGDGRHWTSRPDLLGSTPFSRDFVVEADEEGASRLRFGDGALGMAPAPGTRFTLWCRVGVGREGNVGREVLAHLQPRADDPAGAGRLLAGVVQVRNPLPATGGAHPETPHEVRARAPRAYHLQARGATPEDWVALAEALPGVRRAGARAGWEGTGPQDQVWVQREQGFAEDAAFLARVRSLLEPCRPAGRGLRVLPPCYVGVDVGLRVRLAPGTLPAVAAHALRRALGGGAEGAFSRTAFTFGEGVWLSRVVATAAAVPGVAWVQPTRFARWDAFGDGGVAEEIRMGPHEVARMDDDPAAPWNGTLALELCEGGA